MSSIIRVNDIQDAGGNSIISSNGSGTFSNNLGIANTPMFFAHSVTGQSVSSSTWTKITLATEIVDSDNAFADSKFSSPNWVTNGYDIYNVRDNQIIFGNNIFCAGSIA